MVTLPEDHAAGREGPGHGNVGVPLDLASHAMQTFIRARSAYGGDAWSSQVVKLLEDATGTDLRAPGFPAEL